MIKRIINIVSWITFVSIVLILWNFTLKSKNICIGGNPSIQISQNEQNEFVTETMVLRDLNAKGYSFQEQSAQEINLSEIEAFLMNYPAVKNADAYRNIKGEIGIDIELRRPIARVFDKNGMSVYLDKDGKTMPLSESFTSRVMVFSGNISDEINNFSIHDSAANENILFDIFLLASYIDKDEFLKAQVEQVYINKRNEFEIIPKVGGHRIFLGDLSDIDDKFEKLKTFYFGISPKQWNVYDSINLKFKEQIVCSKK